MPDCLSRIRIEETDYTPKYLHEFMSDSITTTVLQVQTRSRTKETQLLQQNRDTEGDKTVVEHSIKEKNNVQIEQRNFDQIYYFLDNMRCNMIQQLQIRKIVIKEPMVYYQLYKIDNVRKIVFIPRIDGTDNFDDKIRLIMQQILCDVTNINAERIALNVDIRGNARYIGIKRIYRETMRGSEVESTFFLNKVIDVSRIEDIESILHTYHRSKLGGHVGIERMKNSIEDSIHGRRCLKTSKITYKGVPFAKNRK